MIFKKTNVSKYIMKHLNEKFTKKSKMYDFGLGLQTCNKYNMIDLPNVVILKIYGNYVL